MSDQKKVVLAITTYNRLNYLKKCIETWNQYRNKSYTWYLIVADDGSDDGTIEYLKDIQIENVYKYIILNNNTGVHYQTNRILRYCSNLDFNYGFKIDDDVLFLKAGWDDKYINAIEATGYDHLCFFDVGWYKGSGKKIYRSNPIVSAEGKLQSYVISKAKEFQGAFWTFTKRVIDNVGYFDTVNFGLRGLGHIDYTYRCARAGFNDIDKIYDCLGSENFIVLIIDSYAPAINWRLAQSYNTSQMQQYKHMLLCKEDRIYIDYKEEPLLIGAITDKESILVKDTIVFVLSSNKELKDLSYIGIWLEALLKKGYTIYILRYRENVNFEESSLTNGIKVLTVNKFGLNILNNVNIDSLVFFDYSILKLCSTINTKRSIVITEDLDEVNSMLFPPYIELVTTSDNKKENFNKGLNHKVKLIKNTEDILDLFLYRLPSDPRSI